MIKLKRVHLLLIVTTVIAVHAVIVSHRRATQPGDFDVSRELGRRFLAHEELYAGGLHYPYLPTAALFFSPLALVEPGVGFILRYVIALAGLALTLRLLFDLARPWYPHLSEHRRAVTAATLALAAHYIVRDLDDSGPHLILLALIVAGLAGAARGRLVLAGACIGLATAVKAPHGLLIPFFLWTRNTRLAGWAIAATIAWMLAPLPWMGATSWYQHHAQWARTALGSVSVDPSATIAVESEQRLQNQALPAVVKRWAHRWQYGDDAGRWLARLAGLLLLATVAWVARGARPDTAQWLPHASMVLIAALLLSPATWTQHLVLLIPALYAIVARRASSSPARSLPTSAGLAVYVVVALLLNREILGRHTYLTLLDGGLHTCAMLIVFALVVWTDAAASRSAA